MESTIRKALESVKADYADIRVERLWRSEVIYRGRNLESCEASTAVGGVARCLIGGGWGYAAFTGLDGLADQLERAARVARTVNERASGPLNLPPAPAVAASYDTPMVRDIRAVGLEAKRKTLHRYNALMLGVSPTVVQTIARYTDTYREVTFGSSEGSYITEGRPDVALSLSALAREKSGGIQRGLESHGWAAGFEAAEAREEFALAAARRAVALTKAKPVKGGKYTVIMDPRHAGVFIHEAFGHLCEADTLAKTPRLREILRPGRRFGSEELNVIDDGFMPGVRGNSPFDDEGTPRRRVYLIRNGVLEGFLHNRETAARMGAEPTGNARAVSFRDEPIVRMRNTYIDRGTATFDQMVRGVTSGVYACASFGGETEIEQFTFTAVCGYEIVNGRLGEMLKNVVLSGNVFETLANIEMVGDDLEVSGSAGGCGKDGQMPLPLTEGGPHIRVRDVIVGGAA